MSRRSLEVLPQAGCKKGGVLQILAVTGEASGEEHLASVMAELARQAAGRAPHWFGSGGGEMAAQGAEVLADVSRLAAIGPGAALSNLKAYWNLYCRLLEEVRRRRPALAVLVDFPEFNLRLAPRLKKMGVRVCYFIGPQLWAWRPGRIRAIRRSVDRMLVILPFEESYYRIRGVDAVFVGHPSCERLRAATPRSGPGPVAAGPRVGLMPGSRIREVEQILPLQLQAARLIGARSTARFVLIRASGIDQGVLEQICQRMGWSPGRGTLEICSRPAREVLPGLKCAIIKSGTSTLEAMLLGIPFVMVYRMSPWSYHLLRPWVREGSYCLANLVAGREVVPELVQEEARPERVASVICRWLSDSEEWSRVKHNLEIASQKLKSPVASREAARQIRRMLKDAH